MTIDSSFVDCMLDDSAGVLVPKNGCQNAAVEPRDSYRPQVLSWPLSTRANGMALST